MGRRAIAAVLALALAGCGLTQTRGPDPDRPPDQRPDCTESMDAPKRDAIPAVLGFVTMLAGGLFVEVGDDDDKDVGIALIVGGAVVTAGAYASGGIGYFRVKRCRQAIADYEQRAPSPPPSP